MSDKTIVKFLLFILLVGVQVFAAAQSKDLKLSSSKKANKYFDDARIAYRNGDMQSAADHLSAAVEEDPRFKEAYRMLGVIYFERMNEPEKSIESFERLLELDKNYDNQIYLSLGEAHFYQGNYTKAKSVLKDFLSRDATEAQHQWAALLIKNSDFAINARENPVPFNIKKLGPGVNTSEMEYFPALTADQEILYFTRQKGYGKYAQEDIYYSNFIDSNWSNSRLVDEPVTTDYGNEGAHTISPDGKFLIFTSCDKRDSHGGCDLYITKKVGDDWGIPKNLGPSINSGAWESQPTISSDSRALYFVSNRKGGFGRSDIYVSYLGEKGFGKATNLGSVINTFADESRPFIHPDNQTLYFASNGHPGLGRADIFYSRADGLLWGEPVNIGYPINTVGEEPGIFVSTFNNIAYYSSDIEEEGNLDIYSFVLPEEARPAPVTYFKGKTFDAVSKKPLQASVQIVDASNGKTVNETFTDPVNGSFMLCLIEGKDYLCNVSKEGYLFFSENFLLGQHDISEPYIMDIPMKKIGIGRTIVLKNIFFDSGEYELKEASLFELDKLKRLLEENPLMKIEIRGHTDNVGSETDNLTLSENRAAAVYKFLVDNGIGQAQVSYKGFGENEPIADNETDEGRAKNRRTEFTIMEM
ncbi:MAG: OmpA family protein [Chitinophagales bacterium]|nr:OmpA family protein [Chitinophagales bacterium]